MPKYHQPVQNVKHIPTEVAQRFNQAFAMQEREVGEELFGEADQGLISAAKNQMFYRGETGAFHLVPDRNPYEMAGYARTNSLYVLDKDGALHQIGLAEDDGKINITVSEPVKELELPPAPGLLTRIMAWFNNKEAKAKVDAYNNAKEFNDNFDALAKHDTYGFKRNPVPAPARPEEPEKQQPKVEAEPLYPSKMDPKQFYTHLDSMEKQGKDLKIFDVVMKGDPATFYKSMEELIKGQIAGDIKAKADGITDLTEKNTFLDGQKYLYTSLVAGLGNFIDETFDKEEIRQMYKNKNTGSLFSKVTLFKETGMADYTESIQKKNAENKPEFQSNQAQPSQIQNDQLIQAQQSEPLSKGSGGLTN